MQRITCSPLLVRCTVVLVAAYLAGCATQTNGEDPDHTASSVRETTATVTVNAIDLENRVVTLERTDGSAFTVVAGDEVRNLDQVEVGDTVKVQYVEAVVASLQKPGEAVEAPEVAVGMARAEPGEKPAGAVGQQVRLTVKIESVDLDNNIVVFSTPEDGLRAINVKRAAFREYIKGLKPGDQVEIVYTEAVAVSVEETTSE